MTAPDRAHTTPIRSPLRLLASAAIAVASAGCAPASSRPVEVSLTPYAGTDLRTVQVRNRDLLTPYILDTGAGFTVLTPGQIAASGCTTFGRVTGFRADGQQLVMPRCGPVPLGIGGYAATGEIAEFDLQALLGAGAPPVGGLIGMASFADRAVTLDFAHDRVIVETSRSLARRIRGMHPVPIRIVRGPGGDVEPFLEVRAKTGTLWLEIDSGNNGPVFLSPHALEQLDVPLAAGSRARLSLDVPGLGPVPVVAARREMIYDGQLNPAFLRQMLLSIDLARGAAWATLLPAATPATAPQR